MPRALILAMIFSMFFRFDGQAAAGPKHPSVKHPGKARHPAARAWVTPRHRYPLAPYPYYHYPRHYRYRPDHRSVVILPHAHSFYYVPPPVVVTSPFFCILHNHGFVSRVGLLDHLSGMHRIPLDSAASICPDGAGHCIFPSYE